MLSSLLMSTNMAPEQEVQQKIQEVHEHVVREATTSLNCSLASKADRDDVWSLKEHTNERFAVLQAELQRLCQVVADARTEAAAARQHAAQAEATCEELRGQVCRNSECLADKADHRTLERVQEACRSQVQDLQETAQATSCKLSQLRAKV